MTLKPAKTFKQQIEQIRGHGFIVDDESQLEKFLNSANYYRFSAYFLPFKHHEKKPNISLPMKLYEFDKALRKWLYEIIGDIEYYTKTQIAYYLAHNAGTEAHLNQNIYKKKHNHSIFIDKHNKIIKENRKTLVVKHHKEKYNNRFPIWVAIEFYSIGMVSFLYSDLTNIHQKNIAKKSFNTGHRQLSSWLRVLTELRNKCAHYSRLYFWKYKSIPKNDNSKNWTTDNSLFSQIYCLSKLYVEDAVWNMQLNALEDILNDYQNSISLEHMGFPHNWKSILRK